MWHRSLKYFYGYVVLAVSWAVYFCNIGVITYGASAVIAPMVAGAGFSSLIVGAATGICTAMQGVCGPGIGHLITRIGPKLPVVCGNLLLAGAFFLLAFLPASGGAFILLYGFLVGTGMGMAGNLAVQSLINNWFDRKKPLAMALALSSGGVGGFIGPLLLRSLSISLGWRAGWCGIAVIDAVLALLAALFLVDHPKEIGEFPDGIPSCEAKIQRQEGRYITAGQLFRKKSFLLMMVNYISRTAIYYSFSSFAVLFMVSRQVSYEHAVSVMSLVSLVSLLSRLGTGLVADQKIPSHIMVGMGNIAMAAGVFLLAIFMPQYRMVNLGAIVFGIGVGIVNVSLPLTFSALYGARNFPLVSGYATPINYLVGALGPVLVGSFTVDESCYTAAFVLLALFSEVGGVAAILAEERGQGSA